ncbi:MAG: hypothetical protein ACYDC8_02175 [Gammaproteobacteria bacterium]
MKKPVYKSTVLILAALLGVSGLSLTVEAAAGTNGNTTTKTHWTKHHPRRHEVNKRLSRQNRRIHHEVKEGDLTKTQAASLHKDDRAIRQEERGMAKQNDGHITHGEQKVLNQQENGVSQQIGK